ncbi:unnamed protein product [Ectocarpus sp. 12 AP-2014]
MGRPIFILAACATSTSAFVSTRIPTAWPPAAAATGGGGNHHHPLSDRAAASPPQLHSSRARREAAVMVAASSSPGVFEASVSSTTAPPVPASTPGTGSGYRMLNTKEASASWNSLPEMWDFLAGECGDFTAIVDPIHPPDMPDGKRPPKGSETRLTYSEMQTSIGSMAAALIGLGLEKQVRPGGAR